MALRKSLLCRKAAFCTQAVINLGRSEWLARAQPVPWIFSLRALAAQKFLQKRKSLRCCAAGKPVLHASRSRNDTVKDQVEDGAAIGCTHSNGCNWTPSFHLGVTFFVPAVDTRAGLVSLSEKTSLFVETRGFLNKIRQQRRILFVSQPLRHVQKAIF